MPANQSHVPPGAGLPGPWSNPAASRRPRLRLRTLVLWLACAGIGLFWLWHGAAPGWLGAWGRSPSGGQEIRLHTVGYSDLRIGLVEEGQLRAVKSFVISSELKTPAKIAYLIPQGSKVKKDGEVLVGFETKTITDMLTNKTNELEAARHQLLVAQENLKIEESTGKVEVSAAAAALKTAKAAIDRFTQLDTPRSFRDMEGKIAAARKALADAQKALQESQRSLDDEMSVDEEQRKTLEAQVVSAKGQVASAEASLESLLVERKMLKNYDYPRDAAARKQEVEKAELELAKAQVAAQSNLLAKQAEVTSRKADIERLTSEIDECRTELAKCEKKAPADGLVLYGDASARFMNPESGDIRVGTEVYPGQAVLTIPDLSAFEVDILVGEELRGKVDVGCKGTAAIEAISGLAIDAELVQIDSLAQPSNPYDPTSPKGFKGVVRLANSDPRMISGMTAKVQLTAQKLDHVLTVPVEAVFSEEGKTFCYVQIGPGRYCRQSLALGESNDDFVQILNGLKLGDRVTLSRPPAKAVLGDPSEVPAGQAQTSAATSGMASEQAVTSSQGAEPNAKP